MCCRYWAEESLEFREIVEEMKRSPLVKKWQNTTVVKSYGEIRPTDVVPVIAPNRSGSRTVYPMKWGYTGKTLLMNARTETAAEKPTFRDNWARHRCIVPSSWCEIDAWREKKASEEANAAYNEMLYFGQGRLSFTENERTIDV